MRLLLDTHTVIWWFEGERGLSSKAREAIASSETTVLVGAASVWEMSTKRALGRLQAPHDLVRWIGAEGFDTLPIRMAHAELAGALPGYHADPSDRILIGQARLEGLTIVTRDTAFAAYGVTLLTA